VGHWWPGHLANFRHLTGVAHQSICRGDVSALFASACDESGDTRRKLSTIERELRSGRPTLGARAAAENRVWRNRRVLAFRRRKPFGFLYGLRDCVPQGLALRVTRLCHSSSNRVGLGLRIRAKLADHAACDVFFGYQRIMPPQRPSQFISSCPGILLRSTKVREGHATSDSQMIARGIASGGHQRGSGRHCLPGVSATQKRRMAPGEIPG
jgi:hypothetical protein